MSSNAKKQIPFSPPDITQAEIDQVVEALKSGWITTGPKTKQFENELSAYMGTPKTAALSSATAAEECALRVLGIGPGDEVIVPAYTYTATASAVCHVGATPVMVDCAPGSFEMDYQKVAEAVTPKTKAVVPVDLGGKMIDYDTLFAALDSVSAAWSPANDIQAAYKRVPVVSDCAHSMGAVRHGKHAGSVADFSSFSFHAVKNLTTAEGGALTWRHGTQDDEVIYKQIMLLSLHGQNKDALAKTKAGAWEYDIVFPGWKCNMTDMAAGVGLAQLKRYPDLLARRRAIFERYCDNLAAVDSIPLDILQHFGDDEQGGWASSTHLMIVRLEGKGVEFRNTLITRMGEAGVATNVHYKPLPMMTAYRNMGFDINDFPNAFAQYQNEVTLPLHTLLSDEDVDYISETFASVYHALETEGIR